MGTHCSLTGPCRSGCVICPTALGPTSSNCDGYWRRILVRPPAGIGGVLAAGMSAMKQWPRLTTKCVLLITPFSAAWAKKYMTLYLVPRTLLHLMLHYI